MRQTLRARQADAESVEATLRAALGAVECGNEDADVEQTFKTFVGTHAHHRFQRQTRAADLLFEALRRRAQAVVSARELIAKAG